MARANPHAVRWDSRSRLERMPWPPQSVGADQGETSQTMSVGGGLGTPAAGLPPPAVGELIPKPPIAEPARRAPPTESGAAELIPVQPTQGVTIEEAIAAYFVHLQGSYRCLNSAKSAMGSLRAFFPAAARGAPLTALDRPGCDRLYAELAKRPHQGRSADRPPVARALRGARAYRTTARRFLDWCVARGWLPANPLGQLRGRHRRRPPPRKSEVTVARGAAPLGRQERPELARLRKDIWHGERPDLLRLQEQIRRGEYRPFGELRGRLARGALK
jgi:hypothetical protein